MHAFKNERATVTEYMNQVKDQETNALGHRQQITRKISFPHQYPSTYQKKFKSPQHNRSPQKCGSVFDFGEERRKLQEVQPPTEKTRAHKSLYQNDFLPDTAKRVQEIRQYGDDLEQGKQITYNAWKPTTDVGRNVKAGKQSSYQFTYDGYKMPQKLVFGTPKFPCY